MSSDLPFRETSSDDTKSTSDFYNNYYYSYNRRYCLTGRTGRDRQENREMKKKAVQVLSWEMK